MSRYLKLFIASSVLLNLLLAGMVMSNCAHRFMKPDVHKPHNIHEMATSLPPEKRERFEAAMQLVDQDNGELHQKLSDARKKAVNILKADHFDKEAYMAQLQQIHQIYGQIMQHTAETIAGLAEEFSPQDRVAIAEMLRRPPPPPKDD